VILLGIFLLVRLVPSRAPNEISGGSGSASNNEEIRRNSGACNSEQSG
jgi:hypothetical protein